jgi:hypothetical protein
MFITAYFESLMQSWGVRGALTERKTTKVPTFSAWAGILKNITENYENRVGIEQSQLFTDKVNKGKFMSFMFSCASVATDFQTIGVHYDENSVDSLVSMDGSKGTGAGLVCKDYLINAKTGVIYTHPDGEFLNMIQSYLVKPRGMIVLGRKNCWPISPVYNSMNNNILDAFNSLCDRAKVGEDTKILGCIPDNMGEIREDFPVSERQFSTRLVKIKSYTREEWKNILKK